MGRLCWYQFSTQPPYNVRDQRVFNTLKEGVSSLAVIKLDLICLGSSEAAGAHSECQRLGRDGMVWRHMSINVAVVRLATERPDSVRYSGFHFLFGKYVVVDAEIQKNRPQIRPTAQTKLMVREFECGERRKCEGSQFFVK